MHPLPAMLSRAKKSSGFSISYCGAQRRQSAIHTPDPSWLRYTDTGVSPIILEHSIYSAAAAPPW